MSRPLPTLDRGCSAPVPTELSVRDMSEAEARRTREAWSYSGEVWTDADGRAIVVLPSFVRSHRDGFQYDLTPLSPEAAAHVAAEISEGRFTVATDQPHVKVAWRVTPLRKTAEGGVEK